MTEGSDDILTTTQRLAKGYDKSVGWQMLVASVPCVGPAIDKLLTGEGSRIREERMVGFLGDLNDSLEGASEVSTLDPSPEFLDLLIIVFEGVMRTRSERKRKMLANVVARKATTSIPWSEAETAARLLSTLEEVHIALLDAALNAPECGRPFAGLKVVTTTSKPWGDDMIQPPTDLSQMFPNWPPPALRAACIELVSLGLFHDEGVGRWDARVMQYFMATETATWLTHWVESLQPVSVASQPE